MLKLKMLDHSHLFATGFGNILPSSDQHIKCRIKLKTIEMYLFRRSTSVAHADGEFTNWLVR